MMNTWPFPLPTGPVPWTAEQQRAYKQQQRDQQGDAPW